MFGKKKIEALEKRFMELEQRVKALETSQNAQGSTDEKEGVTYGQVIDEWFNGQDGGAKQ